MKKRIRMCGVVWAIATVAVVGSGACNGGTAVNGDTPAVYSPAIAEVRAALAAGNARGMVPGLTLGSIVIPVCTKENTSDDLSYTVEDLPAWLTFDPETRTLSLAEGTSAVPAAADARIEVTYTCSLETDASVAASLTFAVNDLDGGGAVDGKEYANGAVPLVNNTAGYLALNPGNVDTYRTPAASPRKVPTGIAAVAAGMDPVDPADDTADFDGDGTNNMNEIAAGTNLFIAAGAGTFVSGSAYGAGITPKGIGCADLDGDGDLDLVVANEEGTGSITPFINDGGGLTPGANYGTEATPVGLALADFDGDGNPDVAAATNGSTSVSVLLGAGDGTFGTLDKFPAASTPNDVAAGDFNGDGHIDLAVANSGSDNVSILSGAGDGTFGSAANVAVGVEPWGVIMADFDKDDDLDLAVANRAGKTVSVLTNDGAGSFAETAVLASEDEPRDLATADFNGDGALDIAALNWDGNQNISLFAGNGDGSFAAYTAVEFDSKPYELVAADLDGDGDSDLAATRYGSNLVGVLLGNGDGTFAAADYTVGDAPWGIVAADLDGDAKLDLTVSNSATLFDSIQVLQNQ